MAPGPAATTTSGDAMDGDTASANTGTAAAAGFGGALADLAKRTGRSASSVLDEAVATLRRSYVGDDAGMLPTSLPFKKRWSDLDADVVLRQVDPTRFLLGEPFRFVHADGHETVVPLDDVTDLASVPGILTWLVPRYGRHTLPALLHDHLIVRGMDVEARAAADDLFRDAMGATLVPLVRRWLMWTAVSAATNLKRPLGSKVASAAWVGGHLLIGGDLALSVLSKWRVPVLRRIPRPVLVLSPLVTALVWRNRYRFGVISAFATMAMPVPLVAVGGTLVLYVGAEEVAKIYLRGVRRMGGRARVNPVRVSQIPKARDPRT